MRVNVLVQAQKLLVRKLNKQNMIITNKLYYIYYIYRQNMMRGKKLSFKKSVKNHRDR